MIAFLPDYVPFSDESHCQGKGSQFELKNVLEVFEFVHINSSKYQSSFSFKILSNCEWSKIFGNYSSSDDWVSEVYNLSCVGSSWKFLGYICNSCNFKKRNHREVVGDGKGLCTIFALCYSKQPLLYSIVILGCRNISGELYMHIYVEKILNALLTCNVFESENNYFLYENVHNHQ